MKMKSMLAIFAFAATTLLVGGAIAKKSKKWWAHNQSGGKVKVYWLAKGCSGVKKSCQANVDVQFVCKVKHLKNGSSASYKFPSGTSMRRKRACFIRGQKVKGKKVTTKGASASSRSRNKIKFHSTKRSVRWAN